MGGLKTLEVNVLGGKTDIIQGFLFYSALFTALAGFIYLLIVIISSFLLLSYAILGHFFVSELVEINSKSVPMSIVRI
jgi:hypothetical protein